MTDAFEYFLPIVESHQSTVSSDEVGRWPSGVLTTLTDLGILVRSEDAALIRCPECGEHWEEVIVGDGPAGSSRFFINCPEFWRVEVSPEHRQQWRPSFSTLVTLLATSMNLTGKPSQLFPDRLWRLGRITWNRESRDVLFVRGLRWSDGDQLRSQIVRQKRTIIVSATYSMPDDFWRTVPPQLVLRDIASFTDQFEIDVEEVAACLVDADRKGSDSSDRIIQEENIKLLIRRQIKAENKSELTDDVFVSAYRQENSLRGAAAFLSEQTGTQISKDQVKRAVDRHGGITAVLDSEDSDSIIRAVSSQRRDSKGKILIAGKPNK